MRKTTVDEAVLCNLNWVAFAQHTKTAGISKHMINLFPLQYKVYNTWSSGTWDLILFASLFIGC